MRISQAVAPVGEPLTYVDLKEHLRIDISDDDSLVDAYISAARVYVEERASIALLSQTFDYYLDDWPSGDTLYLPRPPLQSVTYVKYYDEDHTVYTFAAASYYVDTIGAPGRIVLNDGYDWPTISLRPANGVQVRFIAGYGDPADVPTPIQHALRLLVGVMYENREDATFIAGMTMTSIPHGVAALLRPYNMQSYLVMEQK
jgi:uncharacterized phiE125 gp8 family phage protein